MYKATGHGGHCLDCKANRDGANCEKCRENYYQRSEDSYCIPCDCNETGELNKSRTFSNYNSYVWNGFISGSRDLQCNAEGKCQCKPGVTGDKCDRCAPNFYNFGSLGCTSCECSLAGSLGNQPSCNPNTGVCTCKENVEGKRCRE